MFSQADVFKAPTLAAIVKLYEDDPIDYEEYGSDTNKAKMELQEFFKTMNNYHGYTRTKVQAKHFMRYEGAQAKFRTTRNLNSHQAADHILSCSVFRAIIICYSNHVNQTTGRSVQLTYDFWRSVKTTINQCWNLQELDKRTNGSKGNVEKELVQFLEKGTKCTKEMRKLVELIYKTVTDASKKKPLFPHAPSVQKALNHFFKLFGHGPVQFLSKYARMKDRCTCEVCNLCRTSSKRWRQKHYVLYQNPDDPAKVREFIHGETLKLFINTVIELPDDRKHILALCEKLEVRTLWNLYTMRNEATFNIAFVHRVAIGKTFESHVIDHAIKTIKLKRKEETARAAMGGVMTHYPYKLSCICQKFVDGQIDRADCITELSKLKE